MRNSPIIAVWAAEASGRPPIYLISAILMAGVARIGAAKPTWNGLLFFKYQELSRPFATSQAFGLECVNRYAFSAIEHFA
jgi:hypothetical protein